MFGLMKPRACSLTAEQKYHRRLHYCGTCKTMGSLYGHRSRVLLNYDAVFLAELLTALSGADEDLREWEQAYQSYNCLSLPKATQEMPLALQAAATATVVLAEFKVADHIQDTKRHWWKAAQRFFSRSFRDASARLRRWGFPLDEMRGYLFSQGKRESEVAANSLSAQETLSYLAEPTAHATGLFFQHGARLVGRPEAQQVMYALGQAFGSLVYLLDAYEDYEKDCRNGDFNALRAAYQVESDIAGGEWARPLRSWRLEGDFRFEIGDFKNPLAKTQRRKARKEPPEQEGSHKTAIRYRLSAEQWQQVAGKLWEMEIAIEQLLRQLPIGAARAAIFSERLKANLSSKLGSKLPIFKHACNHATKLTFTKRRQLAVALGKSVASKYREAKPSSLAALLQPSFVFASVLPVAFFAPHHVMTAGSYRECMSAGCNLMFLGSVFATLAAIPGEGRKKKRECCCECECCGDCCEGGCHCCCNCSDCNCCGDCNCCDCNCCD